MPAVQAARKTRIGGLCHSACWRGILLLALASCLAARASAAAAVEPQRPNILLILGDDIGFSDFGCYGGDIDTPVIDRLAAEGLRFTQFYNNAVCVPTRYSLLTGRYPRYVGAEHRIRLTPETATLGESLAAAGYRTSLSGKWHLGAQPPHRAIDRGFAEFFGLADGCCNYFNPAQRDPPFEGGDGIRDWMHNAEFIRQFPPGFYTTDAIADHACQQIKAATAAGRPFFVHVCFTAAHSPLHARPEDIARFAGRYRRGWDVLRAERRRRMLQLGLADPRWPVAPREPEFPAWEQEPLQAWNENLMAVYAAMVFSLDRAVGRILDTLHACNCQDNTLVMLLNDNGGCAEQAGGNDPTNIAGPAEHYVSCGAGWAWLQNTPLRRYKAWVHEGGIATPCIVRWPGVVRPGSMTSQVGHVIDIAPTLLSAAGAAPLATRERQPAASLEGRNLLPVLRGGSVPVPDYWYWASLDNRAIRQGDWKLTWESSAQRWALYDIVADRTEMIDRSAEQPARAMRMAAAWQAWAEASGAAHHLGKQYDLGPRRPAVRP